MKYLMVLVALAVLVSGGLFYLGQISQNGVAPGLVEGRLTPCPEAPNCVTSLTATVSEQQIAPLPADVWGRLAPAISDMGGTVIERNERYLAAEFSSATFGFVDDMEFLLGADVVHVRSASRVGYSDAGVNSARVAQLRQRLGDG